MKSAAISGSVAIVGGRVVDGLGLDAVGTCLVEDGTITEVTTSEVTPPGVPVIDASGAVVMPGLIDSHSHIHDPNHSSSRAHERMLRAGITTAVDFANFDGVVEQWHESTAGLSVLGLQAIPALAPTAGRTEVAAAIEAAVAGGAFGIKVFGGHYPSTPEATALMIELATAAGLYVGVHVGTTIHGSDLDGVLEAVELAQGLPFHLAHTNSYLRGAVAAPLEENTRMLDLLGEHPEIYSDAYLGLHNSCRGLVVDDSPADHITANCLALRGYEKSSAGIVEAFNDGYAHAQVETAMGHELWTGTKGLGVWRASEDGGGLAFPVNRSISAFMQTCARVSPSGGMAFDGPGEFLVDTISSDGGRWRNAILERGLSYVQLGALTMEQFVHKASTRPAQLFGLSDRGSLRPGARGDVIIVDEARRGVLTTIVNGVRVYDGTDLNPVPGEVLTTARGVARMESAGVRHRVVDPGRSILADAVGKEHR